MPRKVLIAITCLFLASASFAQGNNTYSEWIKKANAFYDARQYQQAANAYTHAFASIGGKAYPDDRYNAACSWSLTGNKDSAYNQLNKLSVKGKYKDYDHMVADTDLVSLHNDSRWKDLCDHIKQNKEKAEANLNKPLVAMLDTIFQNDQEYRSKIEGIEKKFGQQ